MKKIIVFIFLVMLLSASQMISQEKPIMGYDKVVWGVSSKEVRKVYNIDKNTVLETSDKDPNVTHFYQENISDAIKLRAFSFIKDKLYQVIIEYKDSSDVTLKKLQSIVENKFGKQTDYKMETGDTFLLMFEKGRYTRDIYTFGKYSPELVVYISHYTVSLKGEKDVNNLSKENFLGVIYMWKKFEDEYDASQLGF